MSRQLHIVSHSHWDREWHQTFQQFRLRLVRMIDAVIDTLTADPSFTSFMLDGQTIVLEDYSEVRPERQGELRALIAANRLLIGPWYVHPDEFLVSGEAIIRNLLLGARLCDEWGGRMRVGYVPDQFGHIAQLPQIWRGFGIDNSVLWRGVDHTQTGTAFRWEAPDGSSVLVAALPAGYNQGDRLPTGGQALAERLAALAGMLEPMAQHDQPLLIMNGGDHVGVQSDLPDALRAAQDALGDRYHLAHTTLPAHIAALHTGDQPNAVLRGELRSSRRAFILPAVLSSRIWIKQRNNALQTLLERQTEPLTTVAAALGEPYPAGAVRQSWRYLLQNQPHDSVCGCCIDQVHREMVTRYDWSEQIAEALRDNAMHTLAAQVGSAVPGAEDPRTLVITVFNGAPTPTGGRIDLHLHLAGDAGSYDLVDATDGAPIAHIWLGERGESPSTVEVPVEEVPDLDTIMMQVEGDRIMGLGIMAATLRTIGDAMHAEVTAGDQALLSRAQIEETLRDALTLATDAHCKRIVITIHRSTELHLAAQVPAVPACGYRTLLLRPTSRAGAAPVPTPTELLPVIENERYRVEADPLTGALTAIERASGLTIGPLNQFVDGGDVGDLYTYCPPASDTLVVPIAHPAIERRTSAIGQSLHIGYVLQAPVSLAATRYEREAARGDLTVESEITLAPGDPLIRFRTTVHNAAQDHRLRVHMAIPFNADHAHADDAFGMVRRAAQPDIGGDWAELPVGTAPHQGVVAVHGNGAACLLAARGLPEYEVLQGQDNSGEIALTLLRCVGWLSRSDIATRPGDAGPSLPTPEAQCAGSHAFAYALAFGREEWRDLLPAARAFAGDLVTHVGACAEGTLPASGSFVAISPAAVVLSALKVAEDGRGAILRCYNDDPRPHMARIALLLPIKRATMVDLSEEDGSVLFDGDPTTTLTLEVPARRIVSLRLEWAHR